MPKIIALIKSPTFLRFLVLVVGIWARLHQAGNYPFGFDQVQILENSQNLLDGHLTLIGPRTGPAPMFTGPLIYYVNAVALFLIPSLWSLVLTTAFITILTGASWWWLSRKFAPHLSGLIVGIWSLSPLLITLDRVPWNPNLSLLAGGLALFPLLSPAIRKADKWLVPGLVFLGCFLGYQAHFSGLLLPFLVVGTLLLQRRWAWKEVGAAVLGLSVSLLPTLLFDLRHEWLNLRGVMSLVGQDDNVNVRFLLSEGWETLQAVALHIGSLIFHWSDQPLRQVTGWVVLAAALWVWRSARGKGEMPLRTALIWLAGFTLAMSLYRQNKPEYYFLMAFPAAVVLVASVLDSVLQAKVARLGLSLFAVLYVAVSVFAKQQQVETLGIANLQAAAQTLIDLNALQGIKAINYNMQPVDTEGFKYLTKGEVLKPDGKLLQLDYPQAGLSRNVYQFGKLSLWLDPRTLPEKNYLSTDRFILESPKNISLFESYYVGVMKEAGQTLVVYENQDFQGHLVLVVKQADAAGFEKTKSQYQAVKLGIWQKLSEPKAGFIFIDGDKILLYYPQQPSLQTMPDWGNSLNLL